MFFMVMIAVETDKICGKAHGYKGMCIAAVLALLCKYHSVHKVSIALSVIEIIHVHKTTGIKVVTCIKKWYLNAVHNMKMICMQ